MSSVTLEALRSCTRERERERERVRESESQRQRQREQRKQREQREQRQSGRVAETELERGWWAYLDEYGRGLYVERRRDVLSEAAVRGELLRFV